MIKYITILILALGLTSCQRGCQRIERKYQATERDYEVIMYSGGQPVFVDKFRGIINNADGSDGAYYYKGDTLIEISGDYTIKSFK